MERDIAMKILLKNEALLNEKETKHIVIQDEIIQSIISERMIDDQLFDKVIDLEGKIVLPGLTDMHMHLDKSFTYPTIRNRSGTLLEAIEQFQAFEPYMTTDLLVKNMSKSVERAIKHGTTTLRTHLDGGTDDYIKRVVEAFSIVKETYKPYIHMESVLMCDFNMDEALEKSVRWAMENGMDLVGGAPHLSEDTEHNLERIFDIATTYDVDIDIHVDESDDPEMSHLPLVCEFTKRADYSGRVIAGHCTSLSAMEEKQALTIIEQLREEDVNVVTLPGANMYLLGRNDKGTIRRGLTRVRELDEYNVHVAIGSDNIQDPFHPYGKADLLQMALLCSYGAQMTSEAQMLRVLEMISTIPSELMNRDGEIAPGKEATFVILDTKDQKLVLAEQTTTRETWRKGKKICSMKECVKWEG